MLLKIKYIVGTYGDQYAAENNDDSGSCSQWGDQLTYYPWNYHAAQAGANEKYAGNSSRYMHTALSIIE